ncbi:MAG TPA: hypothetical protein VF458_06810 [Ktedonobacteraceae bacterium]
MTNTAEHTPWYASQADNTTDMWEIYQTETDIVIAENITEAHAPLVAAAPDLLEELKHYNWIIEQYLDGKLPKDAAFAAMLANRVNGIAIAKAEGR